MAAVRVRLLSKPGCHLCDDAREAIHAVIGGIEQEVLVDEVSILDDQALHDRYWDEIPVVLINDRVHTIWRVDPARLETALREAGQ